MRTLFLLMIMLFMHAEGYSQQYSGSQEDIDDILVNIEKFSSYVMDSNADKLAECYTLDGKLFPNNREIIEGTNKIKAYWELPEGVSIIHHKVTPSEIKIIGSEAYDYGYYEGKTKKKDGQEVSWKGKYVIVWKKVANEWKIYLDIWNNIAD